jgi:oligopeptide transport system permease protein
MAKFIVQRTAWMFLVLVVISLITFTLMHAVPGGPFTQDKRLPPAILEQLNAKYHLDAPLYVQYIEFVRDIAIPAVGAHRSRRFCRLSRSASPTRRWWHA